MSCKVAVKITHTPTGETCTVSKEKSNHKNKAIAISILKSRLYALRHRVERSDKVIHTYKIPDEDALKGYSVPVIYDSKELDEYREKRLCFKKSGGEIKI